MRIQKDKKIDTSLTQTYFHQFNTYQAPLEAIKAPNHNRETKQTVIAQIINY